MEPWTTGWLEKRFGDASGARVEDFGPLPLEGEIAIWHPLDDIYAAPRVPFGAPPRIEAVWVGEELAGYVLRTPGDIATWRDLGDASTDADRFFVVEASRLDAVVDWFNDELDTFEQLGGERPVETVTYKDGTRMVVIVSGDGNARVRGGFAAGGELVCAVIET